MHQPSDNEKLWFRLKPSVLQKLSLETNRTVKVPDIIRKLDIGIDEAKLPKDIAKELEIYEPLIKALSAHFPEYDAIGDESYADNGQRKRRTAAGCDKTQNKARLFVFPYDWRKSNIESAAQLKDYIDCIRTIYPDARVDIVAHSMGGLIARRMILDTNTQPAGQPHPYVNRLITLGTPWWGAPRANYVLETGDITGHPTLHVVFEHNSLFDTVKAIGRTFPGAHELLPTKLLFQNAPAENKPFGEEPKDGKVQGVVFDAWDIDGSGAQEHNYDYDRFKKLINEKRFADIKPLPMTTNETFHDFQNAKSNKQDDWAKDSTGVTYFHIIGKGQKTPDKVQARAFLGAPKITLANWRIYVEKDKYFTFHEGDGDGTVPLLSAARTAATNANGATLQVFNRLSHLDLVSKAEPLACVLKYLGVGNTCQESAGLSLGPSPASRRVTLVNVQDVEALDGLGNHIDDDGVVVPYYGDRVAELSMPPEQPVTITFSTLPVPETAVLARIMTTNDDGQPIRKVLYLDSQTRQQLPPESTALLRGQLTIDAQGNTTLQYDWNRDGTIDTQDTVVAPTVDSVDPTLVLDEVGPSPSIVRVRQDPDGTRWVTLTAGDPSGILPDSSQATPNFLVSLENDGQVIDHTRKYTPGTEVDVPADKTELTACVVDGAGNRACQVFAIP
jgi:pimeloyl-ACP methyl ester carboxylesterase